jgi:hypothetical protein
MAIVQRSMMMLIERRLRCSASELRANVLAARSLRHTARLLVDGYAKRIRRLNTMVIRLQGELQVKQVFTRDVDSGLALHRWRLTTRCSISGNASLLQFTRRRSCPLTWASRVRRLVIARAAPQWAPSLTLTPTTSRQHMCRFRVPRIRNHGTLLLHRKRPYRCCTERRSVIVDFRSQ